MRSFAQTELRLCFKELPVLLIGHFMLPEVLISYKTILFIKYLTEIMVNNTFNLLSIQSMYFMNKCNRFIYNKIANLKIK